MKCIKNIMLCILTAIFCPSILCSMLPIDLQQRIEEAREQARKEQKDIKDIAKDVYRQAVINLFEGANTANITLMQEALNSGILINFPLQGKIALTHAIEANKQEAVEFLLKNGAGKNIHPHFITEAINKANSINNEQIIKLLLDYHKNLGLAKDKPLRLQISIKEYEKAIEDLYKGAQTGNLELIKQALTKDISVDSIIPVDIQNISWSKIEEIKTPLLVAIQSRRLETVEFLLEQGAGKGLFQEFIDHITKEAIKIGDVDIIQLLIKYHENLHINKQLLLELKNVPEIEIIFINDKKEKIKEKRLSLAQLERLAKGFGFFNKTYFGNLDKLKKEKKLKIVLEINPDIFKYLFRLSDGQSKPEKIDLTILELVIAADKLSLIPELKDKFFKELEKLTKQKGWYISLIPPQATQVPLAIAQPSNSLLAKLILDPKIMAAFTIKLDDHKANVEAVAISHNNSFMVTGSSDKTAKIWDPKSGTLLHTLVGHKKGITSVAISPDDSFMVTGSRDKTAKIWDPKSGTLLHTLVGHKKGITSVAIGPDNSYLVTGSRDKTAKIWDAKLGTLLRTLPGDGIEIDSIAISSDNNYRIVTGSNDKTAKIWDPKSGILLHTLVGHENGINSVAISPDNNYLVTGSRDKTAKIWNPKSGTLLHTLVGHKYGINSVAISPHFIVTGSIDGTAKIWNPKSGILLHTLHGHDTIHSIAMSSDNNFMVTGSGISTAQIWNMEIISELEKLSFWQVVALTAYYDAYIKKDPQALEFVQTRQKVLTSFLHEMPKSIQEAVMKWMGAKIIL